MARSKTPGGGSPTTRSERPTGPETLPQQIDFLLQFGRGTMPIGMLVRNEAEVAEAQNILKSRGKKAESLITVKIIEQER